MWSNKLKAIEQHRTGKHLKKPININNETKRVHCYLLAPNIGYQLNILPSTTRKTSHHVFNLWGLCSSFAFLLYYLAAKQSNVYFFHLSDDTKQIMIIFLRQIAKQLWKSWGHQLMGNVTCQWRSKLLSQRGIIQGRNLQCSPSASISDENQNIVSICWI